MRQDNNIISWDAHGMVDMSFFSSFFFVPFKKFVSYEKYYWHSIRKSVKNFIFKSNQNHP